MAARAVESERRVWAAGLGLGLATAFVLAPKDDLIAFVGNVGWWWLPQLAILALLLVLRVRKSVVGGFATALAAYLLSYYVWLNWVGGPNAMAWLGYWFSLPGAAIAALLLRVFANLTNRVSVVASTAIGFSIAAVGIAANQAVVCATVMHCASK